MGEDDTAQRQRRRKNRKEIRAVPHVPQILPEGKVEVQPDLNPKEAGPDGPSQSFLCATAAATAGPGAPLSPDELLPKGDAEKPEEELEEEDDEELDETLSERLWGLTEMFPERVRSMAGATFDLSLFVAQKMYRFSRAALWIGTTSFMIVVLPVIFATEKLQVEQQQQLQQGQTLLGPNTGLSGGMPGALPSLPGKI
ncbi:mitochondrial import receptor subunit TOM22 homolog [Hippopotamus amphibius kiboko]|uniref:mitochondrial import receptor subunit TOM22 homolog n=1 Tax=Hippopotamus amphibius kiboko TaxID=575201 RepID=UPI002594C319|nr:mitochondrial import receptor subunit TOM22 homolog [Hippopotamus amphibius kiboko]